MLRAPLALACAPDGFTAGQLVQAVQSMPGPAHFTYDTRRAAYDLKKLRGKDVVSKLDNSRRYSVPPQAIRTIAALVILRKKVLRPILAGVGKPRMGRVTPSAEKSAAIVQSNYIPWKGYFDLINMVDEFILLDDVQYTRRDWRNRNILKTANGVQWLTIPVQVKGKYSQKINETRVSDPEWGKKHWTTIVHSYSKAKCFRQIAPVLEPLFTENREKYLSRINFRFIETICGLLGITTKRSWSTDYDHGEGKNERLMALCKCVGAVRYVSGPSAQGYMDESLWNSNGIAVSFIDYSGYPPYTQLYGEFQHGVTILDLLFNEGPDAKRYMKSFGDQVG